MIKELIMGHELANDANKIKSLIESLNTIDDSIFKKAVDNYVGRSPYRSAHSIMWTEIDVNNLSPNTYIFKHRIVYKTKNGKIFLTHRPLDQWLVDKYNLTHYIILPE